MQGAEKHDPGRSEDDLGESEWEAMEDLGRYIDQFKSFRSCANNFDRNMTEIERTLGRGRSSPHVEYDKEKVERLFLVVQFSLGSPLFCNVVSMRLEI